MPGWGNSPKRRGNYSNQKEIKNEGKKNSKKGKTRYWYVMNSLIVYSYLPPLSFVVFFLFITTNMEDKAFGLKTCNQVHLLGKYLFIKRRLLLGWIDVLSRALKSVSLKTRWAHGDGPAGAESLSPDLRAALLSAGVWLWATSICHCVCLCVSRGIRWKRTKQTHTHIRGSLFVFSSLLLRSLDSLLMKQD